jgi:hypothetical protein
VIVGLLCARCGQGPHPPHFRIPRTQGDSCPGYVPAVAEADVRRAVADEVAAALGDAVLPADVAERMAELIGRLRTGRST